MCVYVHVLTFSIVINLVTSPYGGNYSQSHSASSPTYSSVSPQSTDAHHLAAINAHNKLSLNALPAPRSLISPPESPDLKSSYQSQSHFNYGAQPRYEVDRYVVAPQPTQQVYEESCSCCVKPTPVYSAPAP